jgi:hypothetical protein
MTSAPRLVLPFVFLFILINLVVFIFWDALVLFGLNNYVLLAANGIIFLLSLLVFFIHLQALRNTNPNVFIRSIMTGMLIKMFSCVIVVLVYTVSSGSSFNKKGVFFSMLLYLFYLGAEVYSTTQLNRKKNG